MACAYDKILTHYCRASVSRITRKKNKEIKTFKRTRIAIFRMRAMKSVHTALCYRVALRVIYFTRLYTRKALLASRYNENVHADNIVSAHSRSNFKL